VVCLLCVCVCVWGGGGGGARQVKTALDAAAYREFSEMLKAFRDGIVDLPTLLDRLWALLPPPSRHEVLAAFVPFVPSALRAQCTHACALDE
jgi:hypothetical protein